MEKEKSLSVGIFFAILGIVLFSAKAVMVKLAYTYNIDSVTLLLFRMMFAFPFYLGIALWNKAKNKNKLKPNPKDYLWLFFFGFIGYYLASWFDFEGLRYLKAGLERIILFVYPTLVVLLSWIFFKKKLTKIQFIAILITYVGVIITFWQEISFAGDKMYLGIFLIFMSALTYASYLVGSGWLIPKFGVMTFTAYSMLVSTFCVVIHYCFVGSFDLWNYPSEVYYLGIAMALVSTLIPSFLVSMAIDRLGASVFSVFGSLGPISTITLAYFFLNEQITNIQVLGMMVVIAGVTIISKKKKA